MSEGGDYEESSSYDPSHNFADARASFADHAGRSYDEARQSGKTAKDLLPEMLRTDCLRPLVVICDETGSMGTAPGIIFSKAPYLKHEAQTEYLGDDAEISFGAFGDAPNGETYPVQARPFAATGGDIKKRIEELVIEGDGGGTKHESSELIALYYARNVKMPKNAKPIFVLITDEMPYDYVSREMAAAVHVNLAQQISTAEIFEELKAKYAVYIILKPYGEYGDPAITARVRKTWLELVDEGHIANMEEPERVVDIIFGILAMEADRNDYFEKELRGRQTKAQVTTVMRSLKTIHARSAKAENGTKRRPAGAAGKSTLFRVGSGKKVDDLD